MTNAFPKRALVIACSFFLAALCRSSLFLVAQSQPNAQTKQRQLGAQEPLRTASASRIERAPKLDGTLDDPAWQQATPISKFLQRERSEERRVGKECRSRWATYYCKEDGLRRRKLGSRSDREAQASVLV